MARRVSLPQARGSGGGSPSAPARPAPPRRARWRALSLILVHLAVAVHIAHWMIAGTTLTPVEPSEAMQTLGGQALLNAGFVLFALLIVATLVFGGWSLVAYLLLWWLVDPAPAGTWDDESPADTPASPTVGTPEQVAGRAA